MGIGLLRLVRGVNAGARAANMASPVASPVTSPVANPVGAVPLGEAAGAGGFAGLQALVADDSEINRIILSTFLERLGFQVTLAADGAEAVRLWKLGVQDLLCLDIEMPVLDGASALRRMRAEAERRRLAMPLALAVTVNAMTDEVIAYLEAGFDACLPKPFSRNDLVALLQRRWPEAVA